MMKLKKCSTPGCGETLRPGPLDLFLRWMHQRARQHQIQKTRFSSARKPCVLHQRGEFLPKVAQKVIIAFEQ